MPIPFSLIRLEHLFFWESDASISSFDVTQVLQHCLELSLNRLTVSRDWRMMLIVVVWLPVIRSSSWCGVASSLTLGYTQTGLRRTRTGETCLCDHKEIFHFQWMLNLVLLMPIPVSLYNWLDSTSVMIHITGQSFRLTAEVDRCSICSSEGNLRVNLRLSQLINAQHRC